MLSDYKFEEVERQDCFGDGVNDILYFPITDSKDFPPEIREKAEEIIGRIIHTYGLDISKLRLNARMIVFVGKDGNWTYEIAVVISGDRELNYIWIEDSYDIGLDDPLYEHFKAYFMEQLKKSIFEK